ncbi:YbaB/EbfC family nucleoid-associated protein [Candidatus Pelagibacter sp.]|nr:YbaB/EbfC family nucleoid-associated protein [Candidatus Pelagibacter sp.]|tara:strand:+ start:209 stop:526 length:318 start_codon:yes stop_codon:yes gene_type:complete
MTDFSKILEKAKELEKKMKESQEAIKKIEVVGNSGGDLITVKLNGEGEMVSITISEKLLTEEKTIIEDLIKAAHNNAKSSLKSKTNEEISKSAGNFGIPGFKWPL